MPDPADNPVSEFENWTIRHRPAGARLSRLLLLLHGWTGDENSMWVFTRNLPESYSLLAPRALHAAEPGGFSWRPNVRDDRSNMRIDDLRPAAEAVLNLARRFARAHNLSEEQVDLMGFSQGAALANTIALLHPAAVGQVAVLSGFLPRGAEQLLSFRSLSGHHFFVFHGTQDPMVPIEEARQCVRILQHAGADVIMCEEAVAHKVGAQGMRKLNAFFSN